MSSELEIKPVLTLSTVSLWNYRTPITIPKGEALKPENITMLVSFTGTSSESWFYAISVAIEARSVIIAPLLISCLHAISNSDVSQLIPHLKLLAKEIAELSTLLHRLHSNCCPNTFYRSIRPYLAGWNSISLPDGVVYEGTSFPVTAPSHPMEQKRSRKYAGGSNAQSTLIQALDIILGIKHDHNEAGCTGFIHEMREYMPGPHRRFLEDLARKSTLRSFVMQATITERRHSEVLEAYNDCVLGLTRFREIHLQIATRYILIPSKASKCDFASKKGTGGTEFLIFLRDVRDETCLAAVKEGS